MGSSKVVQRLSFVLAIPLVASACLSEAPDPPTSPTRPTFTVTHQAAFDEDFGYETGVETGFTLHFSDSDIQTHGLPPSIAFVAVNDKRAEAETELFAYPLGGPFPRVFDCFDQIEVQDPNGAVTAQIDNFCHENSHPELNIVGDIETGENIGWSFNSPSGRVDVRSGD